MDVGSDVAFSVPQLWQRTVRFIPMLSRTFMREAGSRSTKPLRFAREELTQYKKWSREVRARESRSRLA